MDGQYLFTTLKADVIVEKQTFSGDMENPPGEQAARHARQLTRERRRVVVAWCLVGNGR